MVSGYHGDALGAAKLKQFFPAGLPSDAIEIKSIEVSPDPPQPGQDLTVKVKAHVQGRIEVRYPPLLYLTALASFSMTLYRRVHMRMLP